MKNSAVIHPIEPVFNENSKILILGSFPSVKSRDVGFYYGNAQNRFWRVLSGIFECSVPITIDEKKAFLTDNNIALWDVIHSCEIEGSADSTIKNVTPNDIQMIVKSSRIKTIITNGKTADKLYKQYIEPKTKIAAICLPSTSPANASWSLQKLIDKWSEVIKQERKL